MSDDDSRRVQAFEEWIAGIHRRGKQVFTELARHNIRVFRLSLRSGARYEHHYWIHDEKTSEEWRQDIRFALENGEKQDEDGYADDDLTNALFNHLRQLGYSQIDDVVADVFEGGFPTARHARTLPDARRTTGRFWAWRLGYLPGTGGTK